MSVTLHPLALDELPMLHQWHASPHLRPYYMRSDISIAEIERKFRPRLDANHTIRCRIARIEGQPFGFVQWYPSVNWPDCGAMRAGLSETCSADYFIGDAAFLGRGLAAGMLRQAASDVFAVMPPAQRALCLAHDCRNMHAIHAATAAGFIAEARYVDGDATCSAFVKRAS
jgi:hypothetical protein